MRILGSFRLHQGIFGLALLGALGGSGCVAPTSEEDTTDEAVGSIDSALLNQDEFVYFRCNATGFGADTTTRLKATSDAKVGKLTFNVTQSWMLTSGSGDQCSFLQTNQLDGFGTVQTTFTDSAPQTALVAPAGDSVVAGSSTFNIKYPTLGQYTVLVNWATKKFQVAPAKLVNFVGHVATATNVALPGVSVSLSGLVQNQTRVTDANGNFRFQALQGSYGLGAKAPTGSSFQPSGTAPLGSVTADRIQDFSCTGTCLATSAVASERELVITAPSVITDAVRTANTGATPGSWSFRAMLEQMLPAGADATAFAQAWLSQFETAQSVNGFPLSVRDTSGVRSLWPKLADGRLDLTRAPFRLLAIVNRLDVGSKGNGEGRFVFGLVDGSGNGRSMTVIFEYGLPSTGTTLTRRDWAKKFHALGAIPLGESYNANLEAVTKLFTTRGSSPTRVGGSSINQVRSNEIEMGSPWQLRESHLTSVAGVLGLRPVTTALTPANSAATPNSTQNLALVNYLNTQATLIHGGYGVPPASIIGGESNEDFTWSFGQAVNENTRHEFAGMTCNGCHQSEAGGLNLGGFYQVSPFGDGGADGADRLSDFIKLFEVPRRASYLLNLAGCSGATCSAGADPMFK